MDRPLQYEESLNLVEIFLHRAGRYRKRQALLYKQGGCYQRLTWDEWADQIRKVALGLHSLHVQKGDRVAILSENRPEWTVADFAILSLGAVNVPLYPTSASMEITYILEHAECEIIFLSNLAQFEKIRNFIIESPRIRKVVIF
ncbi:MAG: AMP-binding protein, partial [Candidatus Omnitrophica bacterium]|nr:AMP-binding protein [Candidatus Omnitrophota bacterium]